MQRYVYTIDRKKFVFYKVGRDWFYGKGCHMKALSHNNLVNPTKQLKRKPV